MQVLAQTAVLLIIAGAAAGAVSAASSADIEGLTALRAGMNVEQLAGGSPPYDRPGCQHRCVRPAAGGTGHRRRSRVLCHYGFVIRGLHRLQITTLADNHAMIAAAVRAGFALQGTSRDVAWIGGFAARRDPHQLSGEWSRPAP